MRSVLLILLLLVDVLHLSKACNGCERNAKDAYQGCLGTCDPDEPFKGCSKGCLCYDGGTYPDGTPWGGICYAAPEGGVEDIDYTTAHTAVAATGLALQSAVAVSSAVRRVSFGSSAARKAVSSALSKVKVRMPRIKIRIPRFKLSRG
uniref:Putative secreted protein n=1 Tax=Amblyomma cajennense TaxID=34607 RepID=A0A023FC10_AMBCJ